MFKPKKRRGGRATGRQTTARKGTMKSAKARARSHRVRSESAGRAGVSTGRSRTVGKPAQIERYTNRGPGDIGARKRQQIRAGPDQRQAEARDEANKRRFIDQSGLAAQDLPE